MMVRKKGEVPDLKEFPKFYWAVMIITLIFYFSTPVPELIDAIRLIVIFLGTIYISQEYIMIRYKIR